MAVKYGAENKNAIEALLELTMTDPSALTYHRRKRVAWIFISILVSMHA